MARIEEDMFGIIRPPDDRQVTSSAQTDAEGGGGYRFLMYGPGGKKKPKPGQEKQFDPGAPVEVQLSSQAREAAEPEAAVEVKLSAKALHPQGPPPAPEPTPPERPAQDEAVPIKRINITL